jgi:hypothetical protein
MTQDRLDASSQLCAQPFQPGALLNPAHRPTHHVFTHRSPHVQQRRIEPIAPHRINMRVAPVATQDRQRGRTQNVHHRAPTIALIAQRAIAHKAFPSPSGMEKLRKKQELSFTGYGRLIIKLGEISTTRGVYRPRNCS